MAAPAPVQAIQGLVPEEAQLVRSGQGQRERMLALLLVAQVSCVQAILPPIIPMDHRWQTKGRQAPLASLVPLVALPLVLLRIPLRHLRL